MKKILVIGAGAMGSAFTIPCIDNQHCDPFSPNRDGMIMGAQRECYLPTMMWRLTSIFSSCCVPRFFGHWSPTGLTI